MQCFSLATVEQLLIWLVVIAAIWALVSLLLPLILAPLGGAGAGATVVAALRIVLWAIVAIVVITLVFDLMSCIVGFPRLVR